MDVICCYLHAVTLTCFFLVIQLKPWRASGSACESALEKETKMAGGFSVLCMPILQHVFYRFIVSPLTTNSVESVS